MKLIIDFEATCNNDNSFPRHESEIIEFGCVITDNKWAIVEEFCRFVKPKKHPTLTNFCKELTSIKQSDVDGGDDFEQVVRELNRLMIKYNIDSFHSWGDYDKNILLRECQNRGVKYPFKKHLNLKTCFSKGMRAKRMGIANALKRLDLGFEGTHHRGIDDAINIARIAQETTNRVGDNWAIIENHNT